MNESDRDALDYFGRSIVVEVRDRAIAIGRQIVDGRMMIPELNNAIRAIQALPEEEKAALEELVTELVDQTLHHLLSWLEGERRIKIAYNMDGVKYHSLASLSDGLAGEFEGEDGWAAEFSRYPRIT